MTETALVVFAIGLVAGGLTGRWLAGVITLALTTAPLIYAGWHLSKPT